MEVINEAKMNLIGRDKYGMYPFGVPLVKLFPSNFFISTY